MIKYCIFDLDGTLLNTLGSIRHYLNATLSVLGVDEISEQECRSFIGNGARMLVSRALGSRGITDSGILDEMLEKYNKAYDASPYYLTEPYPEIKELLYALSRRGVTLAVLSNKPDSTAKSVVREFFGDSFSFVLGAKDGVKLKPEPDSCLALMRAMGARPSEVAFIGDSGVDVLTGKRAGAALTIGVSWGFRDKDELLACGALGVADRASEILDMIGEL